MKKFTLITTLALMVTTGYSQSRSDLIYRHDMDNDSYFVLLSESQGNLSPDKLVGATPLMMERLAPDGNIPNAMNAFILVTPEHRILFDTGIGAKLTDNLACLNILPEGIDYIFLTHMHGDHIGGMIRDGEKVFPNATVFISKEEVNYWSATDQAAQPRKVLELYNRQIQQFVPGKIDDEEGAEILSGIFAIQAYGHTPGHTIYLINSGKDKLIVWGDLAHGMAIQMVHPEVAVTYDVDPAEAIESRFEVLEYISERRIPIAGMHIAYPGMGFIKDLENGCFEFIPLENQ